jgi:hypothetical protein
LRKNSRGRLCLALVPCERRERSEFVERSARPSGCRGSGIGELGRCKSGPIVTVSPAEIKESSQKVEDPGSFHFSGAGDRIPEEDSDKSMAILLTALVNNIKVIAFVDPTITDRNSRWLKQIFLGN